MTLLKADIQVIDKAGKVQDTINVQFNPASMQLQFANTTDGGRARARQTQQYNGTGSTTLSLDLEFDTADLDTKGEPVDVRKETKKISQFVLPGGIGSKQAPPRARFRWGTFELTGVMSSLTEDLSYFSSGGVPLRAKLAIQIKEQDTRFEALKTGPGAKPGTDAPPSGEGDDEDEGVGGDDDDDAIDSASEALDGETPADFLARNGLAPAAWRALGGALDALADGIELPAGLAVGFNSSLAIGGGLGVTAGFRAGLDIDADVAIGLGTGITARSGVAPARALSAAGGVTVAIERSSERASSDAASSARASFGMASTAAPSAASAAAAAGSVDAASSVRAPLMASGSGRVRPAVDAAPRERPPQADRRAATFGRGVPLREQTVVPGSASDRYVVLGRPPAPSPIEVPGRSIVAPWKHLPAGAAQAFADRTQAGRTSSCACRSCDPRGVRH